MLSRIKLSPVDIRNALLEVDDKMLSVDDLKAMERQLPTTEEITRLKDFEDVSKLAKADQYFFQVGFYPSWLTASYNPSFRSWTSQGLLIV
jgi:diaphanous 1